ncbi:glycosyltransferase [Roseomonas sp. CECT 9278]|uniref:glycosyltransferase n=1 Tax=Roseomonas sp. CECT 9278 TaxID=2845823 RepID=UPI001EF9C08D|nr:glycosyltransferase [Roseomonas sp. CECT 9278]CAH0180217.1 D-inositol-3-phosphate glycosyltransferase [Roseomonas sp. CECT 9278]
MDGTRFADTMDCDIAVIVPLFRQPALFSEAIASVLGQISPPILRIVIVLDGCVYRQSLEVATAWARANPSRIVILPQANGGVAAARNAGTRFALEAWPDCRALFFLDADNRIGPHMLRRAWDALADAPPEVGWVYPDFDLFGIAGAWSTAGRHHLLQHLSENVCDAAVLVRRDVCAAGIAFDETLKAGFEDWDFFLRAAGAGFRGAHLPQAGFQYRRRPESMLRDARRDGAALFAALQARHPALYAPRRVLELEAAEAPRFAVFTAQGALACLDPVAMDAPGPPQPLLDRLAAARRAPGREHAPALCVFAAQGAIEALRDAGLLRATLAHAERLTEAAPLCSVTLYPAADGRLGLEPEIGPAIDAAQLIVARSAALPARVNDAPLAAMAMRGLAASIPAAVPPPGGALAIGEAIAAGFAQALAGQPPSRIWRPDGRVGRDQAARRVARSALRAWPLLPLEPDPVRRDIAFVTPVFDLGGVERVLACLATELRALGCRTHLVVTGAERIARPPAGAFDGVVLLPAFDSERHGGGRNAYAGAATSLLAEDSEEADALMGLLAPMQAVVTTHAFAGHALAGRLRRMGVRTACALHLAERGRFGEPIGNPHSALAYEHAYDLFIAHSRRLATWCAAAGVPAEKVVTLENAPGYPGDAERIAAARAARQARAPGPLRALFLGRLDRQKGPDRLPAIMAATGAAVEWRVVGRAVLDEPPVLPVPVEPPVSTPAALDALYAWADVLVMPSRFEGVPLTVLEAQRMGCIPVVTDVGGVREAVEDGVDGVVVRDGGDGEVQRAVVCELLRLRQEDTLDLAEGCILRANARSWMFEAKRLLTSLTPSLG